MNMGARRGRREDIRTQLGCDLHDSTLQALAGVALQLEAASELIASDPEAARARIQAIGDMIAAEQRALRAIIQRLKPAKITSVASVAELSAVLEELRNRIARTWPLRIELVVGGVGAIPTTLVENICRIIQEALANVARHAHAEVARVSVDATPDKVCIGVSDDGRGFPFQGRYELAALIARGIGPVSLRERVAALRGKLILTSDAAGSHLDISLPLGGEAVSLNLVTPEYHCD